MSLSRLLQSCSLLCLLAALPEISHAYPLSDDLSARVEVSVKGGSERSILTTEFWAPLAQQSGKVFYGDLRLMGDNDDNREGNLGVGYRQISEMTNSVLGGHLWIDRRRTENNSTFHQVTIGAESLGTSVDLRANAYIPLNGANTVTTPNLGSTTPYLAGSGVFYDTNGSIAETPQYGGDAEIGYRLPVLQKYADTIRVYGGGYSFFRDNTESVTGYRVRTEAVINSIFSVGARFQHDASRGDQGFLEATIRFPFSAKKLYQSKGLYGRLDESPERDVDIVTGRKTTSGLGQPLLNASGTQQRILYVDNSQTNGDGTKEHPFSNLALAQAALKANDILYIAAGNGTTSGMDQGITINQNNIRLVGSGSALTISGYTLINAGAAPTITNSIVPPADGAINNIGDGILVLADNADISGIKISAPQKHGIFVSTPNGETFDSVKISNVNVYSTVTANNNYSVYVLPTNGGTIHTASITDVNIVGGVIAFSPINGTIDHAIATNITGAGSGRTVLVIGIGGKIGTADISNITATNGGDGVYISSRTGSRIGTVNVSNVLVNGNSNTGLRVDSGGSTIDTINLSNIVTTNNPNGVQIATSTSGVINQINGTDIISSNNTFTGISISADGGSVINGINLSRVTTNNNLVSGGGINVQVTNNGTIGSLSLSNVIANANAVGVAVTATSSGTFGLVNISNASIKNNQGAGVYLQANGGTIANAAISSVVSNNNTLQGFQFQSATATSSIGALTLSNSDAIGNVALGVFVNKGNASAVLNADLGGGTLGSTGQNRIFGNVGNDLRVDRAAVFAANNWWNNGGASPSRVTLNTGASVTYTPNLATDPRP